MIDAVESLSGAVTPASIEGTENRIDAAHLACAPQSAAPSSEILLLQTKGEPPPDATAPGIAFQRLQSQAAQLAAYLRARQGNLDQRQAELHSQIARFEHEARTTRLVLSEQASQLEERKQEMEQRLARLAAAEAAAERNRARTEDELARREQSLANREAALEARSAEQQRVGRALDEHRAKAEREILAARQKLEHDRAVSIQLVRQLLEGVERRRQAVETLAQRPPEPARPSGDLVRRERELRQAWEAVERKSRQLDEAEADLARSRAEATRLGEQWAADRREARKQLEEERERMAAEHRRILDALDGKRRALGRQSEVVDRSRAALADMRSELIQMHRETLEIRLATEELWIQLAGEAPPAVLTQSLGQVRAKLADDYRQSQAELAERKREIESLRGQLATEHQKLLRKKKDLENWAARRHDEAAKQAQRLLARERELARQAAHYEQQRRQWEAERLDDRQRLRRLEARLRHAEVSRSVGVG